MFVEKEILIDFKEPLTISETNFSTQENEKLAVLAKIYKEVVGISKEEYRYFVMILAEYKLQCKYAYNIFEREEKNVYIIS